MFVVTSGSLSQMYAYRCRLFSDVLFPLRSMPRMINTLYKIDDQSLDWSLLKSNTEIC